MATNVRAQDDFFKHVNGAWLKRHPIPPHESRWGAFIELRHRVDRQLKTLVEQSRNPLIRNFYRSGMDMKTRNRLGVRPLLPILNEINNLKTRENLWHLLARLEVKGFGDPFGIMVDQDAKRSTHYAVYLEQGGLGLPDRDYYLSQAPDKKRIRAAYEKHIEKLFVLIGDSKNEALRKMKTVMKVETRLARASMDKVSLRDPDKTYHKRSLAALQREVPTIPWRRYFVEIGARVPTSVVVSQPTFMREVGRLIATLPLQEWKTYLTFQAVNDSAGALSQAFINESFDFYGRVLSGLKEQKPLWRRTLMAVNASIGEEVGREYVARYFSPAAKRRMDILVSDLFVAFEARIRALPWMSQVTKAKAVLKLKNMRRKIGYPTKWKSYKGLEVRADDYFGNLVRADIHEHRRAMRKIGRPIDRTEWLMHPQTVNAYFSPTMNEIVFPAAILQPPFFGLTADDATNYGAIGSTIGHELTHGFDDSGAKFDAKGNLKRWWTAKDKKRFETRARTLVRQFDAYEAAPGARVNGKLTLGENIADLGGLAIAYDAFTKKQRTPAEIKKFFTGWAVAEREHARPEYLRMIVGVDPHSPSEFRINGPASNFEPFYKAYGVEAQHALYREPKDRAKIW